MDSGVKFCKIAEKRPYIAVIGSGASIRHFDCDFNSMVTVIAVNGAIDYVPRADFWFTLDPSPKNRRLMRDQRKGTVYYAAVPPTYGTPYAILPSMQAEPEDNVRYLVRVSGNGHGRFQTRSGLPTEPWQIHTGNSGWGAFQMAVHMKPKKIALFGIDGLGAYVYGGMPRHLHMIPELFESSVEDLKSRNIKVVNGSPVSTIECFDKMNPQEAKRWLQRRI